MSNEASELNLLMVHADEGAPVLPDGLPDDAARDPGPTEASEETQADHFWDEGGDPNDVALQRWGVIAPQGPVGDRLLALIKPLIDLRREQQGDEVRIYRVPPRLSQDEAMRWKKKEFDTGADLNIEVPRYQLILGDLDQVSLGLQQVQQSDGYVGRLAFAGDDGYAAYVDKVLRYERRAAAAAAEQARSLFFTVHDGTAATTVGHRALIGPGLDVVRRRKAAGQYPAREILELGDRVTPSPDELLAHVQDPDPAVLFTLSHGEGAPRGGWRSSEEQRRRQGAMSFGREGHIVGEDLRTRPFMPGGVWFMLACYGGGTPEISAYRHWLMSLQAAGQFRGKVDAVLAGLPAAGERPFIASVPQTVLANPSGPLAFFGHIDLAWTYSFQELDSGATNRPARFMAITRSLLKRDRCGVSLRELTRFFDQTNIELTALQDNEARARALGEAYQADVARQGHLWMLRQDLSAYMLLGDPAVRLPSREAAADDAPRPIEVRTPAAPPAKEKAAEVTPTATAASPRIPTPTATAADPRIPAPAASTFAADPRIPAPAASTFAADPRIPAPTASTFAADPMIPAASPTQVSLAILEEALALVLTCERSLDELAARAGVPRDELDRRVAAYRDAGRRTAQ